MLSSYRGIHTSSHTCGRPTSPPVSTARLITALIGGCWKSFLLDGCECYLSSDEDAVLLEVVGMRWFTTLPIGEANRGAIRPFKQHLVPLIVQANPEHICGYWGGTSMGWCALFTYKIFHIHAIIYPTHTRTHLQYPDWEYMKLCSSMWLMLARSPPSLWHAARASLHIILFLSK